MLNSLIPQAPALLTRLLIIVIFKVELLWGIVTFKKLITSLKLVFMLSEIGLGLPHKFVVPPFWLVKV